MPKISIFFKSLKKFSSNRSFLLLGMSFLCVVSLSQQLGCNSIFSADSRSPIQTYEYDFKERPNDWSALFSNYTVGREDDFELESEYRSLPEPLDTTRSAFYLSGRNLSDDLNMFLKHRITDLEPETRYKLDFEVSLASDAPSGCAGVGGPPGEAVTVHTAVSDIEPARIVDDSRKNDYYRLNLAENFDSENTNWYRATEIGDVANSQENCEEEGWQYEIKELSGSQQSVTTDEQGNLWLLTGTRSGFEATTSLYYTDMEVQVFED